MSRIVEWNISKTCVYSIKLLVQMGAQNVDGSGIIVRRIKDIVYEKAGLGM